MSGGKRKEKMELGPESSKGGNEVALTEEQQGRLEELLAQDDERDGFNATHPELNDGERFLTNVGRVRQEIADKEYGGQEEFDEINFLSKRKGEKAYAIDGKPYPEAYPVFISNTEYKNHLNELVRAGKL